MICFFHLQESKDGATEEEEKQSENGKKEEERGRDAEAERETDKTEAEIGMRCISLIKRKWSVLEIEKNDLFFLSQR